ncbi:MAG: phenylalanine--tRNA ligase subunit beta [Lachnospirales bacterium]
MKLPLSMLVDYLDINVKEIDPREFLERLTMIGQKVEVIEEVGKEITNVIIGEILSIEKHPDADKLVVCQVDIKKEKLQIVTAATNVFVGAKVPVALDGAVLHGGLKIKNGKLRGVESQGMFCSIEELGFTTAEYPEAPENGIYIFNDKVEVGSCAKEALLIEEVVVEFEITSNRPDCFSIIGLSREVGVAYNSKFSVNKPKYNTTSSLKTEDYVSVKIEDENCYRYKCAVVKDVKVEPSPLWLRRRLVSAGLRPINNFVDITNYVMMEYGQPMHAFDVSTVENKSIIVRKSVEGEKITTLDGEERVLPVNTMVIADSKKPIAIAGIIGGEHTKITDDTTTVLFECANFDNANVRISSKKLGVRTDSSTKYEKGLDPNTIDEALDRALELVEMLKCGKEISETFVDVYLNKVTGNVVDFTFEGINNIIGVKISDEEIIKYLNAFEIKVKGNKAYAPTFRPDIEIEADLAEEVARAYGYDKIEPVLAIGRPTVGRLNEKQTTLKIIEKELSSLGVSEIKNFSFESPKAFNKLLLGEDFARKKSIIISNPLGEDFSAMRITLMNGMLTSLSTNYNNRNKDVLFYEIGKTYIAKELPLKELPAENYTLSLGAYGNVDFYGLKGILESVFNRIGLSKVEFVTEGNIPYMHPTRTARVTVDNVDIGYIGEVHPTVLNNFDIGTRAYVAEIYLNEILSKCNLKVIYKPIPKFPASTRDIALVVDEKLEVREIEKIIENNSSSIVESIELFDVFRGQQVGENKKSVAYKIVLRSNDGTLTEEEITNTMNKILKALETNLGIELRK